MTGHPLRLHMHQSEAMRVAQIGPTLEAHGIEVFDRGNLLGPANPWQPPVEGFRHLPEVAAWNNAVMYDGYYLVFWWEYVLELARSSRPRRNLAIGERYERVIGTSEYAPTVEVLAPEV